MVHGHAELNLLRTCGEPPRVHVCVWREARVAAHQRSGASSPNMNDCSLGTIPCMCATTRARLARAQPAAVGVSHARRRPRSSERTLERFAIRKCERHHGAYSTSRRGPALGGGGCRNF
eukprot:7113736-Prymnesium_polylepis.1